MFICRVVCFVVRKYSGHVFVDRRSHIHGPRKYVPLQQSARGRSSPRTVQGTRRLHGAYGIYMLCIWISIQFMVLRCLQVHALFWPINVSWLFDQDQTTSSRRGSLLRCSSASSLGAPTDGSLSPPALSLNKTLVTHQLHVHSNWWRLFTALVEAVA